MAEIPGGAARTRSMPLYAHCECNRTTRVLSRVVTRRLSSRCARDFWGKSDEKLAIVGLFNNEFGAVLRGYFGGGVARVIEISGEVD